MNLALVIENFDRGGGGAERSTEQIAGELARRGHRVTVLAGWTSGRKASGFCVRHFRYRKWNDALRLALFSRWARRQIDQGSFDASLSMTTTVPASIVQPRSGTIRETMERNVAMRRQGLFRFFKRLLLLTSFKQQTLLALERSTLTDRRVRHIAAVSAYVARQLERHYHIDPARITIIPNASEMPPVDLAQRQAWRRQVREGFNIPADARVFLFAAMNFRLKGIDTLLGAVAELRRQGREPVLLLAGAMSYAQQHVTAKLGLRQWVRIVGPTDHMAELYCAADVTVLPTYYDPASKVVIESLMMGTPAISTAFNGASDWIVPDHGPPRGRVIPDPADYLALAKAMVELWDQDELERCSAATRGLAQELSMQRHVDQLERLLTQAMEQNHAQTR